jgi:choline dehydrogenase-like flavoprotein
MNSGIGPVDELKKHNVHLVHDLSDVGGHLMDHPMPLLRFRTLPGESLNFLNEKYNNTFYDKLKRSRAIAQYLLSKSGALTTNVGVLITQTYTRLNNFTDRRGCLFLPLR